MTVFWRPPNGLAILLFSLRIRRRVMKHRTLRACLAVLAALPAACGGDAPPTAPVVVAPTPVPTATPPPAGNAPASAVVAVFGYVRREGDNTGRFPVPPAPPFYQIGDAIDIGCTPRDASGRNTSNHPDFVEWYS